jgi:hypothetical protein
VLALTPGRHPIVMVWRPGNLLQALELAVALIEDFNRLEVQRAVPITLQFSIMVM